MDYREKIITAQQAVDMVQSGDYIVTGLAASTAHEFLSILHTAADRLRDVVISTCLPMRDYPCFNDPQYAGSFFHDSWFYSGATRKAHAYGSTSFVPNYLHFAASKRLFHRKPRIFVGAAAMPDKHGNVSLSCSNTYERAMMDAADIVILEISPRYPRTFGDLNVPVGDVDFLIETDCAPPALPYVEPNERDRAIGALITPFINDGDCVQLGIGGMPNAIAESLFGKKDLGIHTEMLTTGMMALAKAGVITGKRKQIQRGKMVCTFILGSEELYEFADDNPMVEVLAGSYTNDPYVIAQNDNMVSINSTMEVDLTGQCASESLGSVQFSGSGGQVDTAVGAQNSKNGRSFICLYSTAMAKNPKTGEREEVSKIVPQLKAGAAVTLSRADVDHVVTEYGVAWLRGTSIRERVERLIAIAHPKFRDELLRQAQDIGIVCRR
ncbi:MAG TPA: acetyl-CoA hydrolase/transferase C-terminal domain-containing protein [Candidatus Limnocylindria bacterium]|nr:acetyl-CoA hydrolase/transferase C-terminal domain-containing protein [Candidatus Limnocylindria bacterium]